MSFAVSLVKLTISINVYNTALGNASAYLWDKCQCDSKYNVAYNLSPICVSFTDME